MMARSGGEFQESPVVTLNFSHTAFPLNRQQAGVPPEGSLQPAACLQAGNSRRGRGGPGPIQNPLDPELA